MATLKEFEEALREQGMVNALAILEGLKKRDRESRSIAPARRIVGRKMTAELARTVLEMHATTGMTQQEIAFKLGVNQGRVNEVIKRGKWLNADPAAPEALSRDKAIKRLDQRAKARREMPASGTASTPTPSTPKSPRTTPASSRTILPDPQAHSAVPPVSPARESVEAELPLGDPRPTKPVAPQSRLKPNGSQHETAPIVSAQLAFLDL